MRVALDARSAQPRILGGVGRGIARIIEEFEREPPTDGIELLLDPRLPRLRTSLPVHYLKMVGPNLASLWLQAAAPLWLARHPAIFHCPWYSLPLIQREPMVVTLHDLSFEHFPTLFPVGKLWSYRLQARLAARIASRIITVSEFIKTDLCDTYGLLPERVTVIKNGVERTFLDAPASERPSNLPDRYVVALGGASRRRLDLAISTWELSVQQGADVRLVVVGPEAPPPRAGMVYLGRPADNVWAAVLAHAEALIYPTSYEGFGMPALEASACGTPVVCSRVGALPEVLGDSTPWASDLTVESLTDALHHVLNNRDDWSLRALNHARAAPTWGDAAQSLRTVYQEVADDC